MNLTARFGVAVGRALAVAGFPQSTRQAASPGTVVDAAPQADDGPHGIRPSVSAHPVAACCLGD